MTPRVEMVSLDLEEDEEEREAALQEAYRRRITWLPVVRGDADHVVGAVKMRDVLVHADRSLEQLVMPVKFVPEVANVLTMLATLRSERVAEAVVVDEWGGTAGVVTLEDLFEEIVGELRVEGEEVEKPVIPLGEGRFRVSGGLSVHAWNDLLEGEVVPNAFETVGGFVTALLGRLPRVGDTVDLPGGIVCEVTEVRGRRVYNLELSVATSQREGAN
jgi:CBS domain containing-hemolysin-like protein